ncbi:MAG: helix-turn-helix domain-containing protein [Clostridia bacterium]|nr:helix-turn-helix domain-containing protein [Clostridia bacterium]
MTGRELIIYILENNLENELIFNNDKILGFMTVPEAAVLFGVGPHTIEVWADLNIIPSIKIGGIIFIPANAVRKKEDDGVIYE